MGFCSNCLVQLVERDIEVINLVRNEYVKDNAPWFIGYSGGKDSSALITLVINALLGLNNYNREITVIYCDTGVENPIITNYVYSTLSALKTECENLQIPIKFVIVKPDLKDRFFVKVAGKGYPPPTNIFRWCTKSLRINPVQRVINSKSKAIVLLGIRQGESMERDRTITKHKFVEDFYLKQGNSTQRLIFAPIINYTIQDVWATLKFNVIPRSIEHDIIGQLYKDAGSECPIYKESKGAPCGKGRFGCWTCTVVRKDRSVEKMIENGHDALAPLFEFRNWIAEFRDRTEFRCSYRRNGQKGLGPITLEGRKIIFQRILELEKKTKFKILEDEEIKLIMQLWNDDLNNPLYIENVYPPNKSVQQSAEVITI